MSEQRLIDANALLDKQESLYMKGNVLFHGVTAYAIENAPTIDPETMPIVQQLLEELAMVKAERDAAVHDLEKAMSLEWEKGEGDVIEFLCSVCSTKECGGICKPKWHGPKEALNNG